MCGRWLLLELRIAKQPWASSPLAQVRAPAACWKCLHHARRLCRHLDGGKRRLSASRIWVSKGVRFLGPVSRVKGPWSIFCCNGGRVNPSDSYKHNTWLIYGHNLVTVYSGEPAQKPNLQKVTTCRMKTQWWLSKKQMVSLKMVPWKTETRLSSHPKDQVQAHQITWGWTGDIVNIGHLPKVMWLIRKPGLEHKAWAPQPSLLFFRIPEYHRVFLVR